MGSGFDPQGRQVSMTTYRDAGDAGDTTTWSFDSCGRMTRKTYPDNSHTDYTYTNDGLLASRTWSRGVVTSYTYDAAGRLLTVSYSDDTPDIAYTYTRTGLQASVTDASGTRVLTHAPSGRVLSETLPQLANGAVSRSYDGHGRLASLELAVNAVPDLALAWQYDAQGRLATVGGGGSSVVYSWRGDGRRLAGLAWQRNDADPLPIAFTYDRWENVAEIDFGLPGQVRTLAYEYDAGGRRTRIALPGGDRWEYQYDRYGQVVQGRKFNGDGAPYAPQQHRYLYDDIGNRKNVHSGAGARPLWYTANALNQYVNWGSDAYIPIAGKASADAKVTVKATANGVSRTYEPVRDGEDFAIDIPVDVSRGKVATTLEVNAVRFDAQQDVDLYWRLSGRYTVTPNAANAMTYDADGNLLSCDGWTLAWNGENRLVRMEKGGHRETYDYDYMGRRFVKKVYGKENDAWSLVSEEYFVYDGYRQIAAYAGASRTLARTYAWDAAGLDTPLWTTDAAGSYFYVADANKNIRMLFNESGEAVAEYDYDPFGQVTATGDYAATNPYRFSSEYHDDGTGMVYYNYRYYSPKLGRWTSRDPIGEEYFFRYHTCGQKRSEQKLIQKQSLLPLYLFVQNNALTFYDLFGLDLSYSGCECCPGIQDAVQRANNALGKGTCKKWFEEHGHDYFSGIPSRSIACHGKSKVMCMLGTPVWTFPGMRIGVCNSTCKKNSSAALASLLIHELAHHYCTWLIGREDCANSAQDACMDALTDL